MTMKKSLIATAVAGVLAIPMAAQAAGYGRLAIGITSENEDRAGTNLDDLTIQDVSSHFGFRGEEDLGNGMTAFFNYEFDIDGADGSILTNTRQSHIGLSGDFGTVKLGRSADPFYEHVGVLTDWGWIAAAEVYYDAAIGGDDDARNSLHYKNQLDAFSFGVAVRTDNDDSAAAGSEDIDQLYLGGTFDFGMGTVSLAHTSESNATGPEPSLTGIGATYDLGEVGLRGAYYMRDPDAGAGAAEPSGFDLLAHTSFGGGLSGFVAVSMLDADTSDGSGDKTIFWGNLTKSLSSRTSLFAEFEVGSVDGGSAGPDTDPRAISVGAVHTF